MSRGGRGSFRGGRGGRGGFSGSSMPPMGLTFADIQSMSKEESELFPPMENMPIMSNITEEERKIMDLQRGFIDRLKKSPYYVVETVKSNELPRYSDKYRPQTISHPTLKKKDLNPAFFPAGLFEAYFNPRKKRKGEPATKKRKLDISALEDEQDDEEDKSSDGGSDQGNEVEEDYDVEEEFDNDYAENYFDNGEGDDLEDMVGGEEIGGGGGDFD